MAGRIDDDANVILSDLRQRPQETGVIRGLAFRPGSLPVLVEAHMRRRRQIDPALARPGEPVVDVVRKAALRRIEIDRGDALPRPHQRNGKMNSNGGLTRSTFFVGNNNHANAWGTKCFTKHARRSSRDVYVRCNTMQRFANIGYASYCQNLRMQFTGRFNTLHNAV